MITNKRDVVTPRTSENVYNSLMAEIQKAKSFNNANTELKATTTEEAILELYQMIKEQKK